MKKLVVIAIMLLATGSAFAQAAGPAPKAASEATLESRVNQRITQMHQRLKIMPAQASAWDAFAQVMRDNVTSIDSAYKERAATIETMSAPDNMRNFAQIEESRAQNVQHLATSFQVLYDTMSDEQKKTADAMFRRYGDRPEGRKPASK